MVNIKQILAKSEDMWSLVEVLQFRGNITHIMLLSHALSFDFWLHELIYKRFSKSASLISVYHFDIFKGGRK